MRNIGEAAKLQEKNGKKKKPYYLSLQVRNKCRSTSGARCSRPKAPKCFYTLTLWLMSATRSQNTPPGKANSVTPLTRLVSLSQG